MWSLVCFLNLSLIVYYLCLWIIGSCVGTFLVNGVIAHVLFDSGATRSFVSLSLRKKLCDAPRTLDFPLEVEIVDDRTVSSQRVHHVCILNLFSERYSIYLVLIPL